MISVHGSGVYFIGNGDGAGGNNKLLVRIGSGSLEVPIAASFKETWHHIAVVRNGSTCTVYLDGASPGGWHQSSGAGVWIGILNPMSGVSVDLGNEVGRNIVQAKFGFEF